MPHHQVPQSMRYAMPGHPSISPPPQLMYHPAAGASPYGAAMPAQWQFAPVHTAGQHPAGSERGTPNPSNQMIQEYLHHGQLPPGMILQQAAASLQSNVGVPSGSAYSPNTSSVAPQQHPQQQ